MKETKSTNCGNVYINKSQGIANKRVAWIFNKQIAMNVELSWIKPINK